MFTRFRNFLYRHRRKLLVTGIIVGGAAFMVNYMQRKFLEWQEKEAREFLKKAKKEQHFRSTERTCNQTIFTLSKTLKDYIFKILDSDAILKQIREGEGNRVTLWEELKIVVFAQICALLYSGLMLVILLRIQLNIIGGSMVRETESPDLNSSSQEKYLSLCQHFIKVGIKDVCNLMKKHSELVLKDVSLKSQMTLKDIEHIFWQLESSLSQDPMNPIKKLSFYLIPPDNGHLKNDKEALFLKNIVLETVDLLQHDEVLSTAESAVKRSFSNTVDKIAEYYVPREFETGELIKNGKSELSNKAVNVANVTVPLAKLVPILHGLYRGTSYNGCPNPWIEQYVLMEQINILGADIYETFSVEESIG